MKPPKWTRISRTKYAYGRDTILWYAEAYTWKPGWRIYKGTGSESGHIEDLKTKKVALRLVEAIAKGSVR